MKGTGWILLGLLFGLPLIAWADTDIGPVCWEFQENSDTLRASATQVSGSVPTYKLGLIWRAEGFYQLLGNGLATVSFDPNSVFEVGFHASHTTEFFGGNHSCILDLALAANLDGAWRLECVGSPTLTPDGQAVMDATFINFGTLSNVVCDPPITLADSESWRDQRAHLPAAGQ